LSFVIPRMTNDPFIPCSFGEHHRACARVRACVHYTSNEQRGHALRVIALPQLSRIFPVASATARAAIKAGHANGTRRKRVSIYLEHVRHRSRSMRSKSERYKDMSRLRRRPFTSFIAVAPAFVAINSRLISESYLRDSIAPRGIGKRDTETR